MQQLLELMIANCRNLNEIISRYYDSFDELASSAEKAAVLKKYTCGGLVLPRGYFCPSPILDLVVGGGNRGRIVKDPNRYDSKEITTYWFDKDQHLCLIERPWKDRELIIREGSVELGILKDTHGLLLKVSRCVYDSGRLVLYERGLCNSESLKVSFLEKETYCYGEKGLTFSTWFRYSEKNQIEKTVFQFDHSPEGYLSKYRITEHQTMNRSDNPWEGQEFTITQHRRV